MRWRDILRPAVLIASYPDVHPSMQYSILFNQ